MNLRASRKSTASTVKHREHREAPRAPRRTASTKCSKGGGPSLKVENDVAMVLFRVCNRKKKKHRVYG